MRHLFVVALGATFILLGTTYKAAEPLSAPEMYRRAQIFEAQGYEHEAGHWYRKAAYHGHPLAQVEVGFMYAYGRVGFLKDPYEADRWYRRGAYGTPPPALASLFFHNVYGRSGVLRDAHEAEQWFERAVVSCREAAGQGDLEAGFMLAALYSTGTGVAQDREKARRLWEAAAEEGHGPSQLALARLYGYEGAHAEAYRWIVPAAQKGLPEAEYRLSVMYQRGHGVEVDREGALHWLQRAARHGHPIAEKQWRGMQTAGLL